VRTVVLDLGHGPRSSKTRVLGACTYTDGGKGLVAAVQECERDLVLRYGTVLAIALAAEGIAVRCLFEGGYRDRQETAGLPDCYLSLHCNAGRGDYSLTVYESGDADAGALSEHISRSLADLPELRRSIRGIWDSDRKPGETSHGAVVFGDRGRDAVRFTPAEVPAVLVEPFFIDQPDHAGLRTQEGLERVAAAVARGVIAWMDR